MQASTTQGGLRGMITWVWRPRTRCAGAYAVRGRILPARERLPLADVSGLVVQVLVTILLGVWMGRRSGAMDSECWLHGFQGED